MGMEHYRPNGNLSQGYFCSRCGAAGMNMYGTGHGEGKCVRNPELVARLQLANGSKGKPHFTYKHRS